MYSGHMLDELVQMVARAEEHARDTELMEPAASATALYFPAYACDTQNRPVFVGVA